MGKVGTQASAFQERSVSEFGLGAEEHTQEPICGQDLDCGFMHSTSFKQPSLKLTKTNRSWPSKTDTISQTSFGGSTTPTNSKAVATEQGKYEPSASPSKRSGW